MITILNEGKNNWSGDLKDYDGSFYLPYDVVQNLSDEDKAFVDKKKKSYQQKQRKKKAKEYQKWSSEDIAKEIKPFNVKFSIAEQTVDRLRDQIKSADEWCNMPYWTLKVGETKVKSWASIYVQGYGYDYETPVTIDTGYNTYETTLFDTKGWHTE